MWKPLLIFALVISGCASQANRSITELPGRLNVFVKLAAPPVMAPGNPMVYVRYLVTVANGNDTVVTLDDVDMEGSFLTTRTTRSYGFTIAPHAQTTVAFGANGYAEGGETRPVTREPAMDRQLPPLVTGPPSMLIVLHVTDEAGPRRETFEQAIAGH